MSASEPRICVGAFAGAHGVRGALKVKSFTADPLAVADYGPVEDEAGQRRWKLKAVREAKGVVIVTTPGVSDRDAAEALRGTRLYVARAKLPATDGEEEFYHVDLIGLRVEDRAGGKIGVVKAIYDFGAGDVLEVQEPSGKTRFLPFTKAVVPEVDVKAGRLIAEPPPETEAKGDEDEVGEPDERADG